MTQPKTPALWTIHEVAEHYRVSERTVRNWVVKGAVEAVKVCGTLRVAPPQTSTTTSTR